MSNQNNLSYTIFDEYCERGFTAGMIRKGPWKNQNDIYGFIRKNLIPRDMPFVIPDQVHGVDIINIDPNTDNYSFEADGVITNRADIALSVATADCIPLILADPVTGYFAAVHVGWRSFVGGIVENIHQYAAKFRMDPKATRFLIGPAIGDCCFEVGPEVAILFDAQFIRIHNGSFYVNLGGALRNKLEALGVDEGNIGVLNECTSCRSDIYYSYRRDKSTPLQMVTFIYKSS